MTPTNGPNVRLLAVAACLVACAARPDAAPSPSTPAPVMTSTNPPPPGPPGPPPPPPPAGSRGPAAPDSPEGRYLAWARAQGVVDPVAVAWRPGQTEPWSFFFSQGAPGQKIKPAAVGPAGIVAAGSPAGWRSLLSSAPAAEVQERVAWMNGMWASVVPGTPFAESVATKHPKAAPHLAAPSVQATADRVVFTAWYAEPPGMLPFRLTITATDTAADVQRTPLHQIVP